MVQDRLNSLASLPTPLPQPQQHKKFVAMASEWMGRDLADHNLLTEKKRVKFGVWTKQQQKLASAYTFSRAGER